MTEEENVTAASTQPTLTTIAAIGNHEGQNIRLQGWLYNLRASGKLLFPIFRDGSGTIQGIVPKAAVPEEVFETLKNLTLESSLTVTGKVRADKRAPSGYELDVESIEVAQRVPDETPFPITLKEHGVDFLMEHRHLWIRTPRQSAILRIRAEIIKAARDYLDDNGFTLTDPPVLTPAACEGTSTLFPVEYFGEEAFLTQSGQLYIESTALALGKVYSFGPTFRAGKIKDPPPPDRVLDGRARDGLRRPRRPDGPRRKLHRPHRRPRPHPPGYGLKNNRPRHNKTRNHPSPVPKDHLRRSRPDAQ